MRAIPELTPRVRRVLSLLYGVIGFLTIVTGWAYLPVTKGPAELPAALVFSTSLFPLWVWGAAWAAAGALGVATAVTQLRRGWFAWSLAVMCFMHFIWFAFYTVAYFGGDHRAFVSAAIYGRPLLLLIALAVVITVLRPKVTT